MGKAADVLRITLASGVTKKLPLQGGGSSSTFHWGRSGSSDIVLDQSTVSSKHAELTWVSVPEPQLRLRDLSSANGTGLQLAHAPMTRLAKGADVHVPDGSVISLPYKARGGEQRFFAVRMAGGGEAEAAVAADGRVVACLCEVASASSCTSGAAGGPGAGGRPSVGRAAHVSAPPPGPNNLPEVDGERGICKASPPRKSQHAGKSNGAVQRSSSRRSRKSQRLGRKSKRSRSKLSAARRSKSRKRPRTHSSASSGSPPTRKGHSARRFGQRLRNQSDAKRSSSRSQRGAARRGKSAPRDRVTIRCNDRTRSAASRPKRLGKRASRSKSVGRRSSRSHEPRTSGKRSPNGARKNAISPKKGPSRSLARRRSRSHRVQKPTDRSPSGARPTRQRGFAASASAPLAAPSTSVPAVSSNARALPPSCAPIGVLSGTLGVGAIGVLGGGASGVQVGAAGGAVVAEWHCALCGSAVMMRKRVCPTCGATRDDDESGGGGAAIVVAAAERCRQSLLEPRPPGQPEPEEASRESVALALVGEMSASAKWKYVLSDDARRSFAAHRKNPFTKEQCREFFEAIYGGTMWKQPDSSLGPLPRKTAWMVVGGCSCIYKYGSVEVQPAVYPPWMVYLMQSAMPRCGFPDPATWPNSCNLNLYEDGAMSVGWHSDDERLFQGTFQDACIISLSLGAKRKFELRANIPAKGDQILQMSLADGDLCTMEGMTQKHYQHRVPKESDVKGPRINLTWRWLVKHTPLCPAARRR